MFLNYSVSESPNISPWGVACSEMLEGSQHPRQRFLFLSAMLVNLLHHRVQNERERVYVNRRAIFYRGMVRSPSLTPSGTFF